MTISTIEIDFAASVDIPAEMREELEALLARIGDHVLDEKYGVFTAAFKAEVEISDDDQRNLHGVLNRICAHYNDGHPGRVMWVFGYGSKPKFSQSDAIFMGKLPDPSSPEHGEPTWDESIYAIEIAERERHP